MESIVLIPTQESINERLDKYISENTQDLSRSYVSILAKEGAIISNGK